MAEHEHKFSVLHIVVDDPSHGPVDVTEAHEGKVPVREDHVVEVCSCGSVKRRKPSEAEYAAAELERERVS